MLKILLSNDDGVTAPGIQTLAAALRQYYQVQVIAPDRNRSGASNALTLDRPLRIKLLLMVTFLYKKVRQQIVFTLV